MKPEVAVLVFDPSEAELLCAILDRSGYAPLRLGSLAGIEAFMEGRGCGVLILDLDLREITNAVLRRLRRKHPLTVIALSRQQFHPELEESLRHHIYACLGRPADPEELLYVLKSVFS